MDGVDRMDGVDGMDWMDEAGRDRVDGAEEFGG